MRFISLLISCVLYGSTLSNHTFKVNNPINCNDEQVQEKLSDIYKYEFGQTSNIVLNNRKLSEHSACTAIGETKRFGEVKLVFWINPNSTIGYMPVR